MNTTAQRLVLLASIFAFLLGCSNGQQADTDGSRKLRRIIIGEKKLEGTPKEIVAQLNILARKHDVPTHEGITIRFDPAVDSQCCGMSISRGGEALVCWLQDVCDACGSSYRVDGTNVVIELLAMTKKQTANIEATVPKGMVALCREFRLKRGQDRYELGKQLFRLLPRSLVTSSKDIGSGTLVTYDYQKPNYKLYKADILFLLGKPDRNVNNERFYYSLHPTRVEFAELSVEFGKYDYAINPALHSR